MTSTHSTDVARSAPAKKRLRLALIVPTLLVVTALLSHGLFSWFNIETSFGAYWQVGAAASGPTIFAAGSSIADDGLSWPTISDGFQRRIEGWGVAGSSPAEWEQYQPLARSSEISILVVSLYDLNEYVLSDFRAEIVPLEQTATDLVESGSDWRYARRLLGAYLLRYLRVLYPTIGRSRGIIEGVRNKKIADWSSDRLLRRVTELRMASQGKHFFAGAKHLAFRRMLRRAQTAGRLIVVVLPVSPPYSQAFVTPEVSAAFDIALAKAQAAAPRAQWIRLDAEPALLSTEVFWDLVHMNRSGQGIATAAFLDRSSLTR